MAEQICKSTMVFGKLTIAFLGWHEAKRATTVRARAAACSSSIAASTVDGMLCAFIPSCREHGDVARETLRVFSVRVWQQPMPPAHRCAQERAVGRERHDWTAPTERATVTWPWLIYKGISGPGYC